MAITRAITTGPCSANDGSIYFVADCTDDEKSIKFGSAEVMKSVNNNIWKMPAGGGTPVQITLITPTA